MSLADMFSGRSGQSHRSGRDTERSRPDIFSARSSAVGGPGAHSQRSTATDPFGKAGLVPPVPIAGAGAGGVDPDDDIPGSGDPLELEHVIGYTGRRKRTLHCHPGNDTLFITCLGANVVLGDVTDPHKQEFLRAHDGEVSALDVSPSGALVASGQVGSSASPSRDAPVVVWDLSTRKQVFNLFGIREEVKDLAFSPDDRFLAASGVDGSLFLWDMDTGEQVAGKKQATPPGYLAWGVVTTEGRRSAYTLSYSLGREVFLSPVAYDRRAMKYVLTPSTLSMPSGLDREFQAGYCTPDGKYVVAGTTSGEFSVFSVSARTYRNSLPVSSNGVHTIVSGGTEDSLFIGSGDGTVKLFIGGNSTWQCASEVALKGVVVSLSPSSSGAWLLAGTSAALVFRVTVGDGSGASTDLSASEQEVSHACPVTCVSFGSARSDVVATGSSDGTIHVWDLSDYSTMQSSVGPAAVTCVWMDDEVDGSVFAGFENGALVCFEGGSGKESWRMAAHRGNVNSVVATVAFLVTGGDDGHVSVWSRRTRELLIQFNDHVKPVLEVWLDVTSPALIHSVGADRSVFSYDLKAEKRVVGHQMTRSDGGGFTCLSQRVDSEQELVTGTIDGRLLFWDCDVVEAPVGRLGPISGQRLNDVAVSKSGKWMAVVGDDCALRVFDVERMEMVASKLGHTGSVSAVRWSPDERQIVTTGADGCVAVWNFYGTE